jgi:hypothetical protein
MFYCFYPEKLTFKAGGNIEGNVVFTSQKFNFPLLSLVRSPLITEVEAPASK